MKNKYIIPILAAAGIAFVLYLIWRKNKLDKEAGEKEKEPEKEADSSSSTPGAGTGGTPSTSGETVNTATLDRYKELYKGINSPNEVRALQKALNKIKPLLSPPLVVDGIFGANTEFLLNQVTQNNRTTLKIIELKAVQIDPTKYQFNINSLYA